MSPPFCNQVAGRHGKCGKTALNIYATSKFLTLTRRPLASLFLTLPFGSDVCQVPKKYLDLCTDFHVSLSPQRYLQSSFMVVSSSSTSVFCLVLFPGSAWLWFPVRDVRGTGRWPKTPGGGVSEKNPISISHWQLASSSSHWQRLKPPRERALTDNSVKELIRRRGRGQCVWISVYEFWLPSVCSKQGKACIRIATRKGADLTCKYDRFLAYRSLGRVLALVKILFLLYFRILILIVKAVFVFCTATRLLRVYMHICIYMSYISDDTGAHYTLPY